jgi:hypothetical protein
MLKSVGIVFGHFRLLPEALPKRFCGDFERKLILCGWRGCLQCGSSVDHDGVFFIIGPAVVKTLHNNSLLSV